MENVKISYQGFHPSLQTQKFLEKSFIKLSFELPTNAYLSAQFYKKENYLKGFVQIFSNHLQIVASAEDNNLKRLIRNIGSQVRKKNLKQRKARVQHQGLIEYFSLQQANQVKEEDEGFEQSNLNRGEYERV